MVSELLGTWWYYLDHRRFYISENKWPNWPYTGTEAHWCTELFNVEDRMVGTANHPCKFSECTYNELWGSDKHGLAASDIKYDPPSPGSNEWGKRWIDEKTFEVWDKRLESPCD